MTLAAFDSNDRTERQWDGIIEILNRIGSEMARVQISARPLTKLCDHGQCPTSLWVSVSSSVKQA